MDLRILSDSGLVKLHECAREMGVDFDDPNFQRWVLQIEEELGQRGLEFEEIPWGMNHD